MPLKTGIPLKSKPLPRFACWYEVAPVCQQLTCWAKPLEYFEPKQIEEVNHMSTGTSDFAEGKTSILGKV